MGDKYLKIAYTHFKDEGSKRKDSQKIFLLGKVYKKVIQGSYKKLHKILNEKLKEQDVEEKNLPLYTFLNFTINYKLEQKDADKALYNKLSKFNHAKIFVMKS